MNLCCKKTWSRFCPFVGGLVWFGSKSQRLVFLQVLFFFNSVFGGVFAVVCWVSVLGFLCWLLFLGLRAGARHFLHKENEKEAFQHIKQKKHKT